MSNTSSIPKSKATEATKESDSITIRPNIEWPVDLWDEVKIAAIQAKAKNFGQFVIDTMAEKVGHKAA